MNADGAALRLQTVVQHHPARAHLLPRLLASLPEGAQIVTDPDPGNPQRNPWRTYLACLHAVEPDATHLLIVQDDLEACRDLAAALDRIVPRHPSEVLVLFVAGVGLHRRKLLAGCANDQRYVELTMQNTFLPACANIYPRDAVASILDFEAQNPSTRTADDGNLGVWAEATGTRIIATMPSLFEHPDHERSLVGKLALSGRNPARIAQCWWGPEGSPLELTDW